jgi:hypothetical protein
MDIISAYREVGTFRGAAQLCGATPKTVKRVVERQAAGGSAPPRSARSRNYEGVTKLVAERLEATGGRISAKRLLPAAQAAGYAGSARNFRRLVAARKALWRRENHRGRRPAVWSPGEHLVIDWGSVGGLHVFCAVLAWCRRQRRGAGGGDAIRRRADSVPIATAPCEAGASCARDRRR